MDSGELPKTTEVRTDPLDVITQPPDVGLAGCKSLLSFVLCLLYTIQLIIFFLIFFFFTFHTEIFFALLSSFIPKFSGIIGHHGYFRGNVPYFYR